MDAATIEIPADITPKAFYEELLPKVFAENRARAAALAPTASQLSGTVRAEVQGDGGGVWTLQFASGELKVQAGAVGDAHATFSQTRDDWQVAITQGLGKLLSKLGSGPAAPVPGAGPRPGLTQAKLDRMRMMKGVLKFELTGYEGSRTLRLLVGIGPGVEGKDPTAVVSVTAADFQDMTTGKLPPQQALMGGKVKLSGAGVAFAMQLGATLMM